MTVEDARERAKKKARDLQLSVNAILHDEYDTELLMARLDQAIGQLVDLAQDWDLVDPAMADRVRQQEQQLHELRSSLTRLGEMEANEASKYMEVIREQLKAARGEI